MTAHRAGSRREAEQAASRLRAEGCYALARFRPEHGGWQVIVRDWR